LNPTKTSASPSAGLAKAIDAPERWTARRWLRALLSPRTAGMAESTPRLNPLAFGLMLGLLALQVVARYEWDFMSDKGWQTLHVLLGWGVCLGIYALFHGWRAVTRISRRTWFVLGLGLVCVTVFWYFGRSDGYREIFGAPPIDHETFGLLVPFMYFASMGTLLRLVVPVLAARFVLGWRPRDFGLPFGREHRKGAVPGVHWVYVALALGMVPVLLIASQAASFKAKYPLAYDIVDPNGGIWIAHLLVYQAFYFLVFLSGESFWRGFLTFGSERDLGLYGLAFMAVPYVTGHFGKPLPETLGAIAAGCVLGFLALRHRSVWWGVALHYGIALSMDLLSIANNGYVIHGGE